MTAPLEKAWWTWLFWAPKIKPCCPLCNRDVRAPLGKIAEHGPYSVWDDGISYTVHGPHLYGGLSFTLEHDAYWASSGFAGIYDGVKLEARIDRDDATGDCGA